MKQYGRPPPFGAAFLMPVSAQTWQGIDVSQYQSDYDFAAAKADGAQIVYLRSSIRASEDKSFERHYVAAKAAGLKVGAYHFLWFGPYKGHSYTLDENLSAAISAVKGKTFDAKYVIDIEGGGLQLSISKLQLTAYVLAFTQRFTAATGIPCAMYTNTYFVKDHLAGGIESLPVWLADYRKAANLSQNSIFSSWVGWQYADNGAFGNTAVDSSYYSDGILIGGTGSLDKNLTRSSGAAAVSAGSTAATKPTAASSADVYRVSSMPYLHLGMFDKKYAQSGMAGMLDLVLALEWVRENISAFGGDPRKVTIMGESGGGMKVNTLMAMKRAKGLFRAAIVESGSGVAGGMSIQQATENAEKLLGKLGITPDGLDRLTGIPAGEILEATRDDANSLGIQMSYMPVADGINLEYSPAGRFVAPKVSADIPLLVGSCEDELALFASSSAYEITWDTLRAALLRPVEEFMGPGGDFVFTEENVDRIIRFFRDTDKKGNSADHLYLKIASLSKLIGRGAYYQAAAKAKQGTAPVYHYLITYDAPLLTDVSRRYAWHTLELPLVLRLVLHPESEKLSRIMAHAWASFIRTENPSTDWLEWPEFTLKDKKTMIFDDICRTEADPLKETRDIFEYQKADLLY